MKKKTKILFCVIFALVFAITAVPCMASGATNPTVSTSDLAGILSAVTDQFSISNITTFIAYIIGASVAFVFLWWGVRKAWRAILAATTRGKAKI